MARREKSWNLSNSETARDIQNYGPLSVEEIYDLYSALSPIMADEHREYLEKLLNGEGSPDPLLDLEMFFRVVNIYALKSVQLSMSRGEVTKDIGALLGEVRQGAVAIESMRNKRKEEKAKVDDEGRVADPTRKSSLSFLQGLDTKPSEG